MFPFLIGTVRTGGELKWWQTYKRVSIPHRYGKNDGYIEAEDAVVEVFPFLIGTVRTHANPPSIVLKIPFPFLIGTVRT